MNGDYKMVERPITVIHDDKINRVYERDTDFVGW